MSRGRDRAQRGLTLIELMVVVVIVGVLMVVAVLALRSNPNVDDVTRRIAAMLREASRKAVAGGTVRADVITATGESDRSRLLIVTDTTTGLQAVTVERLQEDTLPGTASWVVLQRFDVPEGIEIAGHDDAPRINTGTSPSVLDSPEHEIRCRPTGECDPHTLFVHDLVVQQRRARVVVMPLNASPLVFSGW